MKKTEYDPMKSLIESFTNQIKQNIADKLEQQRHGLITQKELVEYLVRVQGDTNRLK